MGNTNQNNVHKDKNAERKQIYNEVHQMHTTLTQAMDEHMKSVVGILCSREEVQADLAARLGMTRVDLSLIKSGKRSTYTVAQYHTACLLANEMPLDFMDVIQGDAADKWFVEKYMTALLEKVSDVDTLCALALGIFDKLEEDRFAMLRPADNLIRKFVREHPDPEFIRMIFKGLAENGADPDYIQSLAHDLGGQLYTSAFINAVYKELQMTLPYTVEEAELLFEAAKRDCSVQEMTFLITLLFNSLPEVAGETALSLLFQMHLKKHPEFADKLAGEDEDVHEDT